MKVKRFNKRIVAIIFIISCFLVCAIFEIFILKKPIMAEESVITKLEYTTSDIRCLSSSDYDESDIEMFNEDGTMQHISPPEPQAEHIDTYNLSKSNTAFNERKIIDSGKPDEESIVITIMGDGFAESEQNIFVESAKNAIDYVLGNTQKNIVGQYPFNLFKNLFTVYAIEVVSNESGVSRDSNTNNGQIVDNYFGSSFYYGNDESTIDRALVITNSARVYELTKPYSVMTIVLCNSYRWGGTGGNISVISIDNRNGQILTHELGHSFGKLADEYYYISDGPFMGREAPNRTENSDPTTIKWKAWLNYNNVGIYPYSTGIDKDHPDFDPSTNKWFRPHNNCAMQIAGRAFCPVCASELIHRLEQVGTNLFDITDIGQNEICIDKLNIQAIGQFKIPDRIDGKIVSQIGAHAFANQNSCSKFILPNELITISHHAFSGCSSLSEITLPASLVNIGEKAFSQCNNLTFKVNSKNPYFADIDGVLYNKNKSELIIACKIPNVFVVPNTISKVSPYAFEMNPDVYRIYFRGNPEIGDYAFANCVNLGTVYFDTHIAPTVGVNVFQNNVPTIFVPYNAQNDFKQAFYQYSHFITSQQFGVDFISNGQVVESWSVYNGSTIEDLPTPTFTGYDFSGWYDNPNYTGTPYTNGDLWESDQTITLYAKWIPKDCTIFFDGYGGIVSGVNPITVKYGETFSINITANKTGNVLDGWYDDNNVKYITADGRSTKPWDKLGTTTLKAKWSPKSYEIQINDDGSIIWLSNNGFSNDKCYIQYGTVLSSINLIAIFKQSGQGFKEGKIFDHFEYNDSTLDWTSIPDLGENNSVITIIPIWINEVHTISFESLCDMVVGSIVSAYDSNITLPTPSRSGYIFDGWYTAKTGGTLITWTTMPDLTPTEQNNGSTQLIANWTAITYKIYYNANGGTGTMDFTTHTYDKSENLRKCNFTKVGHDFMGWATSANGNVTFNDSENVKNLADKQSATVNLYAVWQPKTYKIIYKNLTTDMIVTPTEYTYGIGVSTMPVIKRKNAAGELVVMDKFYYWFTSNTFSNPVFAITKTQTGDVTLYAKYNYFVQSIEDTSTHTVTDAGVSKNPKLTVNVPLYSSLYNIVENTTLQKIRIEFSLTLWEVDDGYQHIYLYNGNSVVWSKKIDHSGGKKTYSYTIDLDISKYKNTDSFLFRFDASGSLSDTWKFNNFSASVYLID